MKTKSIFYFLLLISTIFSTDCFSQEKLKYGFKGGIGLWRFMSLENIPSTGNYPFYSYPLGFSVGFFIENELSTNLSIVNELLYQNSCAKVTIYTGVEGILDQKVTTQFLNIPILLKYQTPWFWNTYFVLGPSFAYLIKANYNYADQVYTNFKGDVEITKSFSTISTSIEFGLGKEIKLSSIDFMMELRAQLGITQFQYYKDALGYNDIGKWRNSGLVFFIGVQL
jgi:hypothetical protein